MTTRHLKKRDRDWAKGMVQLWGCGVFGRNHSTERKTRLRNARVADEFIKGNDPFQQEALATHSLIPEECVKIWEEHLAYQIVKEQQQRQGWWCDWTPAHDK